MYRRADACRSGAKAGVNTVINVYQPKCRKMKYFFYLAHQSYR